MIEIEIPSFFSVRVPRYSFDGGEKISALRFFPPFIKPELYILISEDSQSKKFADTFNRFVIITFVAITLAGFAVISSLLTYYNYHIRVFFMPALLLLSTSLISNFMAWYNFMKMAETYMHFAKKKRDTGINFEYFDINDNGIFKRKVKTEKTDLI
ncbi:MAG TPA: hypothetical protein PLN24_06780 [Victivallales bacterium]|nr:hypothetical protein [Victivallales bacterium]HPO91147.1 hypothetical protein [Victivallales bacterium]HRU02076.1 hypothetical protein [Victivallales bacterium]